MEWNGDEVTSGFAESAEATGWQHSCKTPHSCEGTKILDSERGAYDSTKLEARKSCLIGSLPIYAAMFAHASPETHVPPKARESTTVSPILNCLFPLFADTPKSSPKGQLTCLVSAGLLEVR